MTAGKYTSHAQQRVLRVLLALFGDVVGGMQPSQIAAAAGCTPPQITRTLDNLATAGLAERIEDTGAWRLTPRLPQQAIKVWQAIDRAQRELDQARQRFTRDPG